MTEAERQEAMRLRVKRGGSWRRPPVWKTDHPERYLISAACFEHTSFIGFSVARMHGFEKDLLNTLESFSAFVYAHVVLPNHYHAVIECSSIPALRKGLGSLHGRMARAWNLEEKTPGRKVFHGSAETRQKSQGHFHASINYVHHNPVRHGYVERWQDWPWSSADLYLNTVGLDEAKRLWKAYPIDRYGDGWD